MVDGVAVTADQGLYAFCIRICACAHTARLHARYEALPGLVDVLALPGPLRNAGDRVAEVHGDALYRNEGPQCRMYEGMSICYEAIRYQVPLDPFHRLMYTKALVFPMRRTATFEAAADSFFRLLPNWPKAVLFESSVATDLAVPIGHDAGSAEYLDHLTLVAAAENDAVDEDRSLRMSELPNPF